VPKSGHAFAQQFRQLGTSCGKGVDPLLNDKNESADKPGINITAIKDGALACLRGRIDIDFSPIVRDRLLSVLRPMNPKIVRIDLSAVTHIDCSGLATLIEALKIARSNNTKLTLHGLNDRLLRFFELTGLMSLFNGNIPAMSQSGPKAV
jgi:anti-sigma B factor antagonist